MEQAGWRLSLSVSHVTFHEVQAHVAQLVEHVLGKDEVTRSIRVVGSIQSLLDLRAHTKGIGDF